MEYGKILDNLELILNSKDRSINAPDRLKSLLTELYLSYNTLLSVKYLRDLINGTNKEKSDRVRYLLKKAGLDKKEELREHYEDSVCRPERIIQDFAYSKKFAGQIIPKLYWVHYYKEDDRSFEGFREVRYPLTRISVGRISGNRRVLTFQFIVPNLNSENLCIDK